MTTSSTAYELGDVVLVWFRFTGPGGEKKRPAVILSGSPYHAARADAVMMALSAQVSSDYFGDYPLRDWKAAGLPKATKSKGVIQTIERATIERRLGKLTAHDLARVQRSVREIMLL